MKLKEKSTWNIDFKRCMSNLRTEIWRIFRLGNNNGLEERDSRPFFLLSKINLKFFILFYFFLTRCELLKFIPDFCVIFILFIAFKRKIYSKKSNVLELIAIQNYCDAIVRDWINQQSIFISTESAFYGAVLFSKVKEKKN